MLPPVILYSCSSGVLRPYVSPGERIDKKWVPQSVGAVRKAVCEYVMLLVGGIFNIFPSPPLHRQLRSHRHVVLFRRLHLTIDCVLIMSMGVCLTRDRWRRDGSERGSGGGGG